MASPDPDSTPRLAVRPYRQYRRNCNSEHPEWRSYTFVKVFLKNLPENVTTLEIYLNLRVFGNLSKILLHDTRAGQRSSNAEVYFKPPPSAAPWNVPGGINFKRRLGPPTTVHAFLDHRQPKNFTVENPVSHVQINEEIVIQGTSLDFGVLKGPKEMVVMKSIQSSQESQLRLTLNLKRMEMELYFPILLRSSNRDRVRSYKFPVSLDENFRMLRTRNQDGSITYVLHVRNAPWYTRRLQQKIGQSHVLEAKVWREEDMWVRQTDIVEHKDHFGIIDRTPVELRKNLNTINLSRWTTFALNLANTPVMEAAEESFSIAMKDFSNRVVDASDFAIVRDELVAEARYFKLLDAQETTTSSQALSMQSLDLPFGVRYQLEVCISQGWLNEYEIDDTFLSELAQMSEHQAKQMLVHVDAFGERIFDPMDIFRNIKYRKPVRARQIPSNCVEVYHVSVTATGLLLHSPSVEISNRIIRKYRHHSNRFLRVRFQDDDYRGQTKLYASSNNKMTLIFDRVRRTMRNGIVVAGRKYDLLAWGNSQLRDHGCYFFAAVEGGPNASSIRAEMGAFDYEKVVAKRAARMGQCFSTTQPVHLRLTPISKDNTIPDVVRGPHTFSDGVGKISLLAAQLVHTSVKLGSELPSCFQFRLGGCKGVLAIDPELKGIDVKVRASQFKFDSSSQELEIIRCSEFWQAFLNRQLILVLSALGVQDEVFLRMQKATIDALNEAMVSENAAIKALRDNVDPNRMTLAISDLVANGFLRAKEPFVLSLLQLWRAWSLKYLKEKAKIPISKGAFVLGTIDETGILRGHFDNLKPHPAATREEKEKGLPEIFLQITDPQTGKLKIVEGVCILGRNPSLHLGDIRVVRAINVPALHHLRDCVVMPQTGDRDLPSMCSGGDLDGDDYVVSWDQSLLPSTWNAEPFHYDAPPPKTAVGEICTENMIDFFYDYLQNDYLGRIAHAHLAAADFLEDGIRSEDCLELLHLHSMAVDYPKTGVPALLPLRLERTQWPHFMEKKGKPYHSHKVLGRLYDAVKRVDFKPCCDQRFDTRIVNSMKPDEKVKQDAALLKYEYDLALQRIMAQHKIETEFEVWSTFVMDHSKASRDFKFHEEIGQLSRSLKEEFYHAIVEISGGGSFEHLREFAVAAYQLTAHEYNLASVMRANTPDDQEKQKMPFISFPWVLADVLGKIASSVSPDHHVENGCVNVSSSADGGLPTPNVRAYKRGTVSGIHASSDSETSEVPMQDRNSASEISNYDDSDIVAESGEGVTDDDEIAPTSQRADPFSVLNPFKRQLNDQSKSATTRYVQAPNNTTKHPKSSCMQHSSDGDSLVHVSYESSAANSPMASLISDEPSPTNPQDSDGEDGEILHDGPILPSGTLKDPASMTDAEKAAFFGDDEEL